MARYADAATLFRTALVFVAAYMILVKYDILLTVSTVIVVFLLDFVDGWLARIDHKRGLKQSFYGAKLDIAGDRVTEYSFWMVFTYLGIVPLFVIFIMFLRHSFSDAFTASKGKTFQNMNTAFGKIAYSHVSRGGIGVVKAVTFIYLTLVYTAGYPILIGYALTGILVAYILLRGAAEIYETLV
jgi:phosphatidylglycerophosphate synthase